MTEGKAYASTEARSMVIGAIAFFFYASVVSALVMRYKFKALSVTLCAMPLWLALAGALYYCTLAKP